MASGPAMLNPNWFRRSRDFVPPRCTISWGTASRKSFRKFSKIRPCHWGAAVPFELWPRGLSGRSPRSPVWILNSSTAFWSSVCAKSG